MAQHPYMPLFPEKFFADTAHVSAEAAAFYMVLLAHAWARGGSLPHNDDQLRLMTRLSGHRWRAIRGDVLAFFALGEDGRLHQKRMDKEWSRVTEARDASITAGSNGGRKGPHPSEVDILSAKKVNEHDGKKANDFYARARAGQATHIKKKKKEEEEGASAPFRVRAREDPSRNLRQEVFAVFEATGRLIDTGRCEVWLAQGRDPAICAAVVREHLARKPNITTLAYFDKPIAEAHAAPVVPFAPTPEAGAHHAPGRKLTVVERGRQRSEELRRNAAESDGLDPSVPRIASQ